jgi:ABC-2 type transport system ATP-binding protein
VSCLLGPNGAGKTTIVKILAGLVLPDKGDAFILGVPLTGASPGLRGRIGLASPNERSFYWRLTGRQNLDFFASLHGLTGREREARVSEVLSAADLLDEASKPFRVYSSGMRQRLLLARALLGRPDILLLDEPTNHLDPLMRSAVHRLIRERLVGEMKATVLLCTHDLAEAQELADHLVFLNNGSVQAEGTLASLRARLQPHVRVVLEFAQFPQPGWDKGLPLLRLGQADNTMEAEVQEQALIPDVLEAAISAGARLLSCRHHEESLSEMFQRLSGGGVP